MTVDELKELLTNLPGDAQVILADGSGYACRVEGEMSPARVLSTGARTFDYWNDNEEDAASYADQNHGGPAFGDLARAIVLYYG
ncbi:hypothetical protein ABIE44_002749 [Marmoricola sp. OAE513]|uniref:hypothetical protein n=1 Tax=Marmoricola sp. OAE513 TaxID=2817894 RepID=UPI001AE686B2